MTLHEHLDQFYHTYNIPEEGGVTDKTFDVPLPGFTLTLPNSPWRRKMLYIHDLEHILNEQDTSWKGEMFIASWEIATGYYRNFPIIIFPLWTMGWGLWIHPKTIFTAFRKGSSDRGIARLNLEKKELLQLDLLQLQSLTLNRRQRTRFSFSIRFIVWSLVTQLVFLFPVIFLTVVFIIFLR
jgi:hypothetical protein